jgi:hypothetical protein
MTIHVERLCGPKHQNTEKIGARDECNQKRQIEYAWVLAQAVGKHRMLVPRGRLPDEEGNDQEGAKDERH